MHDTFYFPDGRLLRTHTSPVQIRAMHERRARRSRIIAPGEVYRCDSDMTHSPMFHQIEGLLVDENISFANLKAALHGFMQSFFERDLAMRCGRRYFPFTEPSAEVDMSCVFCEGRGCRTCKHTGWLEIARLRHGAPERAGRAASIRSVTPASLSAGYRSLGDAALRRADLRSFFENDLRFLKQFADAPQHEDSLKFPDWLRELVERALAVARELAHALTMAGLESKR